MNKLYAPERRRVRKLILEGFGYEELALMYDTTVYRIKKVTNGLKKPARI